MSTIPDIVHSEVRCTQQLQVLQFWDNLTGDEQSLLCDQLKNLLPLQKLCDDFKKATETHCLSPDELRANIHRIPDKFYSSSADCSESTVEQYWNTGLRAISRGEVGVILMAGGQGTRLGVSYPKGMYNVGLPSQKSLFQLQAERILRLQAMATAVYPDTTPLIPWYIMTSSATRDTSVEFFEANSNFGLEKSQIMFFEQGVMPCFDFDGKFILEAPYRIAMAPDGNGGLYKALHKCGVLEDMRDRGVKYLHAYCVDNVLVRVADPIFVGFCISNDADCGNKVVEKRSADEPVGVVCLLDGVGYSVVEYSEMPPELTSERDAHDKLVFRAGNIANHFFTLDFLTDICTNHVDDLSFHLATKKIPCVSADGQLIRPTKPNGVKLEKFVFDVFPFAKRFFVWEVSRQDEFSPLKNASGADSPSTCCQDVYRLHRRWLEEHGVRISADDVEEVGGQVAPPSTPIEYEISPLVTYRGEDLHTFIMNDKKLNALLQH